MQVRIEGFKCYPDNLISSGVTSDKITLLKSPSGVVKSVIFDIPFDKITLLKGPSGTGKSTIFHAITWCLYNSVRGVDPRGEKKGALSVEITFTKPIRGILSVYRQKKPCFLRVVMTDGEHIDAAGQSIINNLLVESDMWNTAGYIAQGEGNGLLSRSGSERMDVINRLAFDGDDPEVLISKIETEIASSTAGHRMLQDEIARETYQLSQYVAQYRIDFKAGLTLEAQTTLNGEILAMKREVDHFEHLLREQQHINGMISGFDAQIQDTKRRLSAINITTTDSDYRMMGEELDSRTKKRDVYLISSAHIREEKVLRDKIAVITLPSLFLEPSFTPSVPITRLIEEERAYAYMNDLARRCGVAYTTESIQEMIGRLETLLSSQGKVKVLAIGRVILGYKDEDVSMDDVKTLEREIETIRSAIRERKTILACPHCNGKLKYINGVLQTCEGVPPIEVSTLSSKEIDLQLKTSLYHRTETKKQHMRDFVFAIGAAGISLAKYASPSSVSPSSPSHISPSSSSSIFPPSPHISQYSSSSISPPSPHISPSMVSPPLTIDTIRAIVADIGDVKELTGYEVTSYSQTIGTLRSIRVLSNPMTMYGYNSNSIATYNEYKELQRRLSDTSSKIVTSVVDYNLSEEEKRIRTLSAGIQDYLFATKQRAEITSALQGQTLRRDELFSKLDPSITERLTSRRTKHYELEGALRASQYANHASSLSKCLEEKKGKIEKVLKELRELDEIKKVAREVECMTLQRTVDNMNRIIADIVDHLFTDPITVTVNLLKETKTSGKIKPNVNISIIYKGAEYDSVSQLSGGEAARLNLALTLAINHSSSLPFLFFDEIFSSISNPMREAALETIRTYATGKTVVIIAHEAVEGIFDEVIDLGR